MQKTDTRAWFSIACLSLLLMAGLTSCVSHRYDERTGRQINYNRRAEPDPISDQRMEDSRTAERVREALAADADYKYDAVTVAASDGFVRLKGLVNTNAQRARAGEVASKVVGVMSVENALTVKN
jgi:osmotically-inducible protein OsmY